VLLISTWSILSIGFLIASIVPTARFVQPIGAVIMYPMIGLSGLFLPFAMLPPVLHTMARMLPLTYAVALLQGIWNGDAWSAHIGDVAALFSVCSLHSTFREDFQVRINNCSSSRRQARRSYQEPFMQRPRLVGPIEADPLTDLFATSTVAQDNATLSLTWRTRDSKLRLACRAAARLYNAISVKKTSKQAIAQVSTAGH